MSCSLCGAAARYAYNLARFADQGLNTLTGGDPRQTVSARLGRAELNGVHWAAAACRVLGWIFRDPTHCINAVWADDNRMEVLDIDGPADGP